MIQLLLDNSYSRILGLSPEQHRQLKDLLSYEIDSQQAYFSGSFRTKRTLLGKKGEFPTGLLSRVKDWIQGTGLTVTSQDNRRPPKRGYRLFNLNLDITPYPDQENAVKVCLERYRGICRMVTGYGKSVTMALLVNALQVKTLIVVPNLELKRQLTESFNLWFGPTPNIIIENIDSPVLKSLTDFDCLIIDEAHHSAARTYRNLNRRQWTKSFYRICFTATPYRSREEEQLLMESVTAQVIYSVPYKEAVAQKAIVPVEAYYLECPKIDTDGYTWQEVYSDLVVNNEARNKIIKDVIHTLEGQHVLTLVKEIKHGEWLKIISGSPFANGQDESSRPLITQFASGQIKSLIGTTGVLGEGIDTKPAEWVIIAGLGKSKPAFMQQVGRGLRNWPGKETCKVILLKDKSHKWTLAHFNAQVKILKEEFGVVPVKLDLP